MNIDLKINGQVIGALSISQEDHTFLLSNLPKKQATEYKHIVDNNGNKKHVTPKGKIVSEATGNIPLMGHVQKFKSDGVTPIMKDAVTVSNWVAGMSKLLVGMEPAKALIEGQRLLDRKIYNSKKRAEINP